MFNSSHEMRLKTPSRHHVWEILISKAQPIVNKEGFSQISRNSLLTAPSYLPILAICLNLLDLLKTFAFKKLIKYVALLWRGDWGKLEGNVTFLWTAAGMYLSLQVVSSSCHGLQHGITHHWQLSFSELIFKKPRKVLNSPLSNGD